LKVLSFCTAALFCFAVPRGICQIPDPLGPPSSVETPQAAVDASSAAPDTTSAAPEGTAPTADVRPVAKPIIAPDEAPGDVSWGTRQKVMLRKLVGPQAFYETVPGTLSDHARNFPEQWGRGGSGFGKRLASQYGQFALSTVIESMVQSIHKEDPRYFRLGQGGAWRRTGHAIFTSFWVHKPGGGNTFAYSLPAAVYGSWAVATRWSPPDLQTPGKIILWGSVGMGVKVSANILREFWPDVKQRLFRK